MLALCVWYLIGAVIIYPHYISYFNEFAGGADNGWRYLRGSNIDFGQDLPSLASYMKKNKIDEINLHYCGTAEPAYYGIRYKQFNQKDFIDNKTGVYAVGADAADLAQGEKPTAKAGYSIFIYDFRDKAKTR
jgi:hypothetical protein